ncbi:PKD domain-containing protein [Chitinophaga filiformis]|uniref:PKD domain-containing protein n=1 Tax=Chitinophaga filiformis TaxID=104663 RepID=UPI001F307AC1|nr:PKD domain-containing protein [Chitinophaga filiformis]MCF6407183.1 PKD domain-containing protein [Chitinophaga filiformis]
MSSFTTATPTVAFTYAVVFIMLLISITAHAQLKADFTPSKTSDCESLVTTFNDNSTGNPVSWYWNLGNGFTSTEKSPGAAYTSAGIFTVTLTVKDAAGNTSTATKTVTVWDKPKPDFTASPTKGCIPLDVTFTDKSDPVDGTITAYRWDFGDGAVDSGKSVVHKYNDAVSPTVTLTITNSNGCTASRQISNIVDVTGSVVANFNVSGQSQCTAPAVVTVKNTSSGPGDLTYKWDFGDGSTASEANPGPHTYTAIGAYKIKLTVANDKGCSTTRTADISVGNFKADFQLPDTICESITTATFKAVNNPQPKGITWSVNKGTITGNGINASYSPNGAGKVMVTMTADYGSCKKVVTKEFVVKPAPKANFVAHQFGLCEALTTVKLTNTSQGATSWEWSFGNGQSSTEQHPTTTYERMDTFSIALIASNASGCSSTAVRKVAIVTPEVQAIADMNEGCPGLTTTFSSSINTNDVITSYEWDFGDGSPKSTAAKPSHTYNNEGTYPVTLNYTTATGCKGTVKLHPVPAIEIRRKPKPDFSSPDAPQICGNNWVHFNSTTDVGNAWAWDFGDSTMGHGLNTTHSYRDTGTYTVKLIVSNFGCSETVTKTAFIRAVAPLPRFSTQTVDCDNRTEISFDEQSPGPITSWKWSWGDGKQETYTTKTSPVKHKYGRTGEYLVKLTVTDGTCTSTDSMNLKVYAPSRIAITADKWTLCTSDTLKPRITVIDRFIYDGESDYRWFSSDSTPVHWNDIDHRKASFTNLLPGKDTIRLIAYNREGCPDSSNKIVVNVHGPVAKFLSPDKAKCQGTELTFIDQTDVSKGKPIESWLWDFGDGNPPKLFTAPPFKHKYNKSGYLTPKLTVTDQAGCSSTYTGDSLQVNGPNASFVPSLRVIPPGGGVWLFNYTTQTGGSSTYLWDLGDKTTSTEYSPYKVYMDEGIYTVTLTATDNNGCKDTAQRQVKVSNVTANYMFTTEFVTNSGCPPVLARFYNTSVNHTSSYWDFGDGSSSTLMHPVHTYTYAGKYIVKLRVVGEAGAVDVYEQEVEITGPQATIVTSSNGGCLTKEIEFKVTATAAVYFAWDFTDGIVAQTTDSTIKHTFKAPGIYKPRLILSDQAGCKGAAFLKDPIVIDKLDVQLNSAPALVCDEGWISFAPKFNSYSIDELKQAATYKWTYEAGLTAEKSASATPRFYLDKIKGYDFSLTTTTAYGCTQTVSKTVYVHPKPEPAISGPLQACPDAPVSLSGAVSKVNEVNWKWNLGNGNTADVQQPGDQVYTKTGPVQVSLAVTSREGCSDTAYHNINVLAKPVVNASSAAPFVCLGKSTTLKADGGTAYEWTPALGLSSAQVPEPVATPDSSTTYLVTVTDANGCKNTDEVSIRVAQPFRIQATPDTILCLGDVLPLWVSGTDHYVWKGEGLSATDSQFPTATIKAEGKYTFEVTGYDADGCFTHDTSLVVHVPALPTVNAGPDHTVMAGTPVPLSAQGSEDVVKWNWTPPEYLSCTTCSNPEAIPNLSTNYMVEVENGYGCKAIDAVFINVTCNKGAVFLPNAFTPNKDGKNEWFYPIGRGIKEVKWMRVYDRWGNLVFGRTSFQINTPAAGWDGMVKNQPVPIGTYVYAMEAMCEEGTSFLFRGVVTVIR